jgi:hypothetical protein
MPDAVHYLIPICFVSFLILMPVMAMMAKSDEKQNKK